MKSVGHIYCVTCLPTGKLYFGQTVTPIGDRWVRHLSSSKKGSNHKFHRAIRKYGEKNPFYHRTHSEDSRKRISEKKRGENHHFFGKKFTDEHRKKLSEARQRYLKNKLNS